MNGLLGSIDDPRTAGLLGLGLRLMSTPGKFGQALGQSGLGAMGDMRQAQASQDQRKRAGLQEQLVMLQLQQAQQQQAQAAEAAQRQKAVEGAYGGAIESPAQQALAGGGGPTVANAQAMQGMQPRLNQNKLIQGLMQADPMSAAKMLQPQPGDYKVVGDSLVQTNAPGGPKSVYQGQKPTDWNQLVVLGPDGKPMLNKMLLDAKGQIAEKGAARQNVQVGTGKVGELETSYRKEFNALPEVTKYKNALPAFRAVESAATREGPQADINLIYGLAKLYDPESVVREGEYDTIANSQSIPEWIKGAAQKMVGGGRLTPETKKQILTEARARIGTFENEYKSAQQTYGDIVRRQGLEPQNIFTQIGGYQQPKADAKPTAANPNNGWTVKEVP